MRRATCGGTSSRLRESASSKPSATGWRDGSDSFRATTRNSSRCRSVEIGAIVRQVPRFLSVLSRRASRPPLPVVAFRGLLAGDRLLYCRGCLAQRLVVRRGAYIRLRLRVDRPLRVREESPRHVPASALQPDG